MFQIHRAAWFLACVFGMAGLTARPASAEIILGLSQPLGAPTLVWFDSTAPIIPLDLQVVSGVVPGQSLVAIDVRPATGQVYGVGIGGPLAQLYQIALDTGVATPIGPAFEGIAGGAGVRFGLDFNPSIDRVRMVSSAGQNLVFHPDTGAVTVATNLAYAAGDPNASATPSVADIGYDTNVAGTPVTQQRGIDTERDVLVTVANNAGTLGTIGSLGVNVTSVAGYDVSGATGIGYAVMTPSGKGLLGGLGLVPAALYRIDGATGTATKLGLAPALPLCGMTVLP